MLIVVLILMFRAPSRVLIRPGALPVVFGARHSLLFGGAKEEASPYRSQQETN